MSRTSFHFSRIALVMRCLITAFLASIIVFTTTACSETTSETGKANSPQVQTGGLTENLTDKLVAVSDFGVKPLQMTADEPALGIHSYASKLLFPESCESGKSELAHSTERAIVGFYTLFESEYDRGEGEWNSSRNRSFAVFQEVFRFTSPQAVAKFMSVVQISLNDEKSCAAENSNFNSLVSNVIPLRVDEYGLAGVKWNEEQNYKTPALACGEEKATYRITRWVQSADTEVYITTAQGVECGANDGRRQYVETVRLGELAAKSISN